MREDRRQVHTYVVHLMCEKCPGEMLPTGVALLSHPPQYPHKCSQCGHEDTPRGGKHYPHTEHDAV